MREEWEEKKKNYFCANYFFEKNCSLVKNCIPCVRCAEKKMHCQLCWHGSLQLVEDSKRDDVVCAVVVV